MHKSLLALVSIVSLSLSVLIAPPAYAAAPTVTNSSTEAYYGDTGWQTAGARLGTDGLSPVIVRGAGFTGASVSIGGSPVSSLVIESDTRMTFIAPAHPHGTTQDLEITNADGTTTLANYYTYYTRPVVLTPPEITGVVDRGETLTLTRATWQAGTWNSNNATLVGCTEPVTQVQTLTKVVNCNKTFTGGSSATVVIDSTHFCSHLALREDTNNGGVHNYQTSISTAMVLPQSAPYAICYFPNGATGSTPATGSSASPTAASSPSLFKTNEVFVGWNTQADGSGDFYRGGATLPSDRNVLLYAQFAPREIYQLAEINPGSAHALIYWMSELGGKLYLNAKHPDTGRELFVYDGNTVELVTDLNPGSMDGLYEGGFLANTGTEIYFQATDGVTGFELYKFDGTTISLVADVNPTNAATTGYSDNMIISSNPGSDGRAVFFGGKLYFEATYPSTQGYVYDPASDTLETFASYFGSVPASGFRNPHVAGGYLFFVAGTGAASAIYATQGAAGTAPAAVQGTAGTWPGMIGSIGPYVVFSGTQNLTGDPFVDRDDQELMRFSYLNMANGVSLVSDINPIGNPSAPYGSFPGPFVNFSGRLYFPASSGFASNVSSSNNRELYSYDGATVSLVQDLWPGSAGSDSGWPNALQVVDSELFFSAQASGTGRELWKFASGTASMIEDSMPGSTGAISGSPHITSFGGQTVLSMRKGNTGLELYAYGAKPPGHQIATYNHPYTITYDPNGGTGSASSTAPAGTVTLDSGSGFNRTGKVLLGWDPSSTATTPTYALGSSYSLSANTTLFAIWGDPVSYTITYDPNGGSGSATDTQVAGAITLDIGSGFANGTRTLLGWDLSSTATTPSYGLGASFSLSGNVTIYAIWSAATSHTITYDPNGGSGSATDTQPAGGVSLNSGSGFSNGSRTLLGWDTSSSATTATYPLGASYQLSGNITLYAVWSAVLTPPATSSPVPPRVVLPAGPVSTPSGGDVDFEGENLDQVIEAEVDNKDAEIKSRSQTKLTLGLPPLAPGLHDLTLVSDAGRITISDAISVTAQFVSITPGALSAWTKLSESGQSVSFFAKNPVGLGKVQFMANGKEVFWSRAIDESDPKLSLRSGASYNVRRLELLKGRNHLEIYLEGERVFRATYWRKK